MSRKDIFHICMLLSVTWLITACSGLEDLDYGSHEIEMAENGGVLILCEGNFNSGNSTLSYYDPQTRIVENGVFRRVNDRKLGDTGQSISVYGDNVYIAVENSGIIWCLDVKTLKVKGQLTASSDTKIINPRFVHKVSEKKAYVTDLYSHYINVFNPSTMEYIGSIDVSMAANKGYCSTEEMVQFGKYVFTNCWSYSNKILVIDTEIDRVVDEMVLSSWQPKSLKLDKDGKIWVITDGGYDTGDDSFGDNIPHLYRIDAASRKIELDKALSKDDGNVQIAINADQDRLYIINNDIYSMNIHDNEFPSVPLIYAQTNSKGEKDKLYGLSVNPYNDEIYVADAIDYSQPGIIYRYSADGKLLDQFKVGVTPNSFAFTTSISPIIPGEKEEDNSELLSHMLVNKVYEYMPAPGHQVNGYSVTGDFIKDGATMQEACDKVMENFRNMWMISLGGQGGYVVAGWDHDVINSGDYDIVIKGNPYSYQSEPGIIWVSRDDNLNGLPDDEFYELAGSEWGTPNETLSYEITYYKPVVSGSDIEWKDNQGGTGIIPYMANWNTHPSYWQDWVEAVEDKDGRLCRTYKGSRLKDTHTYVDGYSNEPAFAWGYADNGGEDYFRNEQFPLVPGTLGYYKISNAVKPDGTKANLSHINFIKIQTAQTGWTPNLGEISTEVYGIWDYHYQLK